MYSVSEYFHLLVFNLLLAPACRVVVMSGVMGELSKPIKTFISLLGPLLDRHF